MFDEIWPNFFMRSVRPEDACQKRFSWFSDWNPKVQDVRVNLVDLVESFLNLLFEQIANSNEYLLPGI